MEAWLRFQGIRPLSKQHSHGKKGKRHFVKPEYLRRRQEFSAEAQNQLDYEGWEIESRANVHMGVWITWNQVLADDENVIGIILDALEGVAYKNDCQVRLTEGVHQKLGTENIIEVKLILGDVDDYVCQALKKAESRKRIHKNIGG